jgi:glutamyl-tRNA synthetase
LEIDELVLKHCLINAIKYKGKADSKSTLGAIIQSDPKTIKPLIAKIRPIIATTIEQVNSMSLDQQKEQLLKIDPQSLPSQEKKKKEVNIELPNLDRFKQVSLRLAPYPSGPLHIGNSRMVVLNDYLAKKYNGKLYLVFDDTIGSKTKIIDPDAYDSIPEGLEFLDVKVHKTYYKSDRLHLFYDYCIQILEKEHAYVCDCDGTIWRTKYKVEQQACPCRSLSKEENLARWEKMLDGTYPEQGAVVRLKVGMDTPDPAIRDPVMLRISERDHPRVGSKYRVWPLLEFSWGIDDHELTISHIVRGKDLRKEGVLEEKIWDIFNWKKPSISLYGRMKLKDLQLSKSKAAQKIRSGEYQGWTDPRTWTLQSLDRRGIQPEAIRKSLLAIGMSPVDVTFSPDQIYSVNRKLIDSQADRYFFTTNPVVCTVTKAPIDVLAAKPLRHPEFPEKGTRLINVNSINNEILVNLPYDDIKNVKSGKIIRLKDLMNVKVTSVTKNRVTSVYHSMDLQTAREEKAAMIQWTPDQTSISTKILNTNGSHIHGLAEPDLLKAQPGSVVQFERFAFCRVESINTSVNLIWTHK